MFFLVFCGKGEDQHREVVSRMRLKMRGGEKSTGVYLITSLKKQKLNLAKYDENIAWKTFFLPIFKLFANAEIVIIIFHWLGVVFYFWIAFWASGFVRELVSFLYSLAVISFPLRNLQSTFLHVVWMTYSCRLGGIPFCSLLLSLFPCR